MTSILKLFPSWAYLVLGGAVLAFVFAFGWRQGAAGPRLALAEHKAAQSEAGRVAALGREREQAAMRERETTWQARFDEGARDGQKAQVAALADAGRAQSALDGLRRENAALRAAVRGSTASPGTSAAGAPAGVSAGVPADVLDRFGARIDRLGARAGVYARFADLSHAAGTTCERSADTLREPIGISLFR